jgi:hypothetical protein
MKYRRLKHGSCGYILKMTGYPKLYGMEDKLLTIGLFIEDNWKKG